MWRHMTSCYTVSRLEVPKASWRVKSAKSTAAATTSGSTKSSRRRASAVVARPYTPQHANIKNDNEADIDKYQTHY